MLDTWNQHREIIDESKEEISWKTNDYKEEENAGKKEEKQERRLLMELTTKPMRMRFY